MKLITKLEQWEAFPMGLILGFSLAFSWKNIWTLVPAICALILIVFRFNRIFEGRDK